MQNKSKLNFKMRDQVDIKDQLERMTNINANALSNEVLKAGDEEILEFINNDEEYDITSDFNRLDNAEKVFLLEKLSYLNSDNKLTPKGINNYNAIKKWYDDNSKKKSKPVVPTSAVLTPEEEYNINYIHNVNNHNMTAPVPLTQEEKKEKEKKEKEKEYIPNQYGRGGNIKRLRISLTHKRRGVTRRKLTRRKLTRRKLTRRSLTRRKLTRRSLTRRRK